MNSPHCSSASFTHCSWKKSVHRILHCCTPTYVTVIRGGSRNLAWGGGPSPFHPLSSFLADVNSRSRSLYAIADPSVCRLSVKLVHPTQPVEIFIIFSPYDSPGTLVFWGQNSLVGTPISPWNLRWKWPTPSQTAKFRPISAHNASTVTGSEKSSIITYRKSTTRFPTSHRWTVYVTPKGYHKNAISLFVSVKLNFCRKKVCYKVSLDENFQRQSCSYIIPLSNGP